MQVPIVESDAIVSTCSSSVDIALLDLPHVNSWLLHLKFFTVVVKVKLSCLLNKFTETCSDFDLTFFRAVARAQTSL